MAARIGPKAPSVNNPRGHEAETLVFAQPPGQGRSMQIAAKVDYYRKLFGWSGALKWSAMKALRRPPWLHSFQDRHTGARLWVRLGTTDAVAYENVIVGAEYAAELGVEPEFIVDCGANVGFAARFFARRYPEARIVAIEADRSNYEMMLRNVGDEARITPVHAAVWNIPGELRIAHTGDGHWGRRVGEAAGGAGVDRVKAMTIPQIMSAYGLPRIDLLKIDIEGAEAEVFSGDTSWLERVNVIAIELHDRFKPGCSAAFEGAVGDFPWRWTNGENLFVARTLPVV
jgi:FkbM family methyltransferase